MRCVLCDKDLSGYKRKYCTACSHEMGRRMKKAHSDRNGQCEDVPLHYPGYVMAYLKETYYEKECKGIAYGFIHKTNYHHAGE